ncbi:MAG: hypothetical protein CVU81_00165 [Euryarchaeota archaeon HGW-Euryarchaeota-1]|nr:MAG: hypothetical protein CVU81_00165 [Euryarchaeota archaeon HGW-Euryarchaeota-1]
MQHLELVKAAINAIPLSSLHIDSYNYYVVHNLMNTFADLSDVTIDAGENGIYVFSFSNLAFGSPENSPKECILRDLNYSVPIFAEVTLTKDKVQILKDKVKLCDFPIMIGSVLDAAFPKGSAEEKIKQGADPYDVGGYFIVNGVERFVIAIEELVSNKVLTSGERAQVFSYTSGFRAVHALSFTKDHKLALSFGRFNHLPVVALFKILGIESDKEIIQLVNNPLMYVNFQDAPKDREEAIELIGAKAHIPKTTRHQDVLDFIHSGLLPHIGRAESADKEKALYLAHMINEYLKDPDFQVDKDFLGNKELLLVGEHLKSLMNISFHMLTRDMTRYFSTIRTRKREWNLSTIINSDSMNTYIYNALRTGMWPNGTKGVTHLLEKKNAIQQLTLLRQINSNLSMDVATDEARRVHGSQIGRICIVDTPEDSKVGLTKQAAIFAITAVPVIEQKEKIMQILKNLGAKPYDFASDVFTEKQIIFYDTVPIMVCEDVISLKNKLRNLRQQGIIDYHYQIYSKDKNLYLEAIIGMLIRALIVVKDGKSTYTKEIAAKVKKGDLKWFDLVNKGIIEYLGADEENEALVAFSEDELTKENTHIEIHPTAVMGVAANMLPLANYNDGPRLGKAVKEIKGAAAGIYHSNFFNSYDVNKHVLNYLQKPLVRTAYYDLVEKSHLMGGQNLIVAFIEGGSNMEDAIMFNKASIERGVGRSIFSTHEEVIEKKYANGLSEKIQMPGEDVKGRSDTIYYSKLEDDGVIGVGETVSRDNILVGRVAPPRFMSSYFDIEEYASLCDTSISSSDNMDFVVDDALITYNEDLEKIVKMRLYYDCIPEIGDKFSLREGQKGVISAIIPENDMPFSEKGIIPDVLFNPHGVPSRMTYAQLLAGLLAKYAVLTGKLQEGSAFDKFDEDEIGKEIEKYGYEGNGNEAMYNPRTGEKLKVKIFIVPLLYQRLEHLVSRKMQVRTTGPRTLLTRQPTEGKSQSGGLKFGEMEKDALIAHGAVTVLDSLFDIDSIKIPVSSQHLMPHYDYQLHAVKGVSRQEKASFVEVPFVFNTVLNYLRSMGISPVLKTEISKNKDIGVEDGK